MRVKLKGDKVFKNTVDGVYVEVGGESVDVSEKIGRYLLESFPAMLERAEDPKKKSTEEVKDVN